MDNSMDVEVAFEIKATSLVDGVQVDNVAHRSSISTESVGNRFTTDFVSLHYLCPLVIPRNNTNRNLPPCSIK